ncbi:MAG: diversity-generating retroelement protein Avd [Blastocatellia bacterium]
MKKKAPKSEELPIIQKTYDLIVWFVPILNRLPHSHKFMLGDKIIERLYRMLEQLVLARYEQNKLPRLEGIDPEIVLLRYQTRLLRKFELIDDGRYEFASKMIDEIGRNLGGWMGQQKQLKQKEAGLA